MISNTLFITYTIMCFLSLQAITLIIFILRNNKGGNAKLLKAARNFIIISIILGLFYYITYYRELILGLFAAGPFLRALDSVIFYAMGYSWIKFIDAIIDSKSVKLLIWRKTTAPVFAVLMIISAMAYVFLLDEYYTTNIFWAEVLVISLEVVLGCTVIIYTLAYILIGIKELTDMWSKRYIITISILVNFNNLWNNIVVISVFINAVSISAWCTKLYGVTSILLLIINLLTLIYVYIKDFSPTFKIKNHTSVLTDKEAIDMVSQKYRLTEREHSVLIYAYEGLNNPDIADKLFISKHTVKRHMHNIFEKLGVSKRVELVHIIKSQVSEH